MGDIEAPPPLPPPYEAPLAEKLALNYTPLTIKRVLSHIETEHRKGKFSCVFYQQYQNEFVIEEFDVFTELRNKHFFDVEHDLSNQRYTVYWNPQRVKKLKDKIAKEREEDELIEKWKPYITKHQLSYYDSFHSYAHNTLSEEEHVYFQIPEVPYREQVFLDSLAIMSIVATCVIVTSLIFSEIEKYTSGSNDFMTLLGHVLLLWCGPLNAGVYLIPTIVHSSGRWKREYPFRAEKLQVLHLMTMRKWRRQRLQFPPN